jgi:hypothetical protein
MDQFLEELKNNTPKTEGPVFQNLLDEYQKIVLRSLVTTFGLDFLIRDQFGGDVDTVHNVRSKDVGYKNPQNEDNFFNREKYDSKTYHRDPRYKEMVSKVRVKQEFVVDAYVPGNKIFYSRASFFEENPEKRASLDHIVSANEINEDPGRILSGLDGIDLANSPDNLHFTNVKLNSSKSNLSVDEFIKKNSDQLSNETKTIIKELDNESRKNINKKISDSYYSSDKFYIDTFRASHSLGVKMSIREAMGFILVEIFFSCKERIEAVPNGASLKDYLSALNKGIDDGFHSIKNNYDVLFKTLGEGYVSGVVASLSATLINAYITTHKVFIKNIRTASVTLVRASNVLLFNPDGFYLGDRFKTTSIIITTGISTILGVTMGEYLKKSPIASIPEVGNITIDFIQVLISGLLSYTFIYMMDRSKFINNLVNHFNKYAPVGYDIDYYCKQFEVMTAQLSDFDIETFVKECDAFDQVINQFSSTDNESSFESILDEKMNELEIELDDLDDFLDGKKSNFNIN